MLRIRMHFGLCPLLHQSFRDLDIFSHIAFDIWQKLTNTIGVFVNMNNNTHEKII